jgi:hypothetical protein
MKSMVQVKLYTACFLPTVGAVTLISLGYNFLVQTTMLYCMGIYPNVQNEGCTISILKHKNQFCRPTSLLHGRLKEEALSKLQGTSKTTA